MPILEESSRDTPLYRMRHSLSHVMAQAVQKLYPGTLLGFGPPIDDGFYYDFIFPGEVTPGEKTLSEIEETMREIIRERQGFEREDLAAGDALERIRGMKEPHKLEYAQELIEKRGMDSLSFYTNGPFVDMCEGPHVDNTSKLPLDGFTLRSVAGAYWRGDERNVMMTRIYAYAYPNRKQLRLRKQAVQKAQEREHRKLGQELSLFAIRDEVGRGLPLWLPNGTAIRQELEKLADEMEFKAGYKRVATPHITKAQLYRTSGHLPLYEDGMYPPMLMHEEAESGGDGGGEPERYYLKPMNCPHHHMVFASEMRSYRDLPLRLAEYGSVYRFEKLGALQGLARVRGMTMNDAHIYTTPEQLKDEFKAVMEMHKKYYELFEFEDYFLRLSLWDPEDPKRRNKYFDDPEAWAATEKIAQEALEELGLYYKVSKGEAAFYGPKVDFQFRSVIEKEYTVSTNQIDFAVPPRFGLKYVDRDGTEKTPYCIHRAPLGTHERFIAFLVEHYGGAFPTWLAPVQVLVLPISERHLGYARKIEGLLRQDMVRAEVDESDATTGKKIRSGATRKIPMILIVGDKEEEAGTVTVRRYGIKQQENKTIEAYLDDLRDEIKERRHVKAD
ncbi:MAG: threonine--tRNA ligase [bacterium]|nr:threonine--tRNA ligase [bacterium]